MKRKTYPKYKPSGVEWLGDVPEHWETLALRRISTRYSGGTPDRSNDSYWEEGTVPWINSGAVNQGLITEPSAFITDEAYRNSSAKWVAKGALVMALAGQGKTKGLVAQTGFKTTCNQSMAAICPTSSTNPRYLYWLLVSQYEHIRNMAGGEQRDGLNLDILGSIPCLSVPVPEQRAIAAFLDRETGRIDTLIAKKRELVERLKEKRTALITSTVTRGLPAEAAAKAGLPVNPPLKPSGLDWLGDIPAHWSVMALKWRSRCRSGDSITTEGVSPEQTPEKSIPVIGGNGVMGYYDSSNCNNPVLVIGRVGALCGNVHLITPPAWITDNALVMPTDAKTFSKKYLAAVLRTRNLNELADKTAQPLITGTRVRNEKIPVPPFPEQVAIATYLDAETAKLDALVAKVEEAVKRLQEYRTALITAAVTGKIDMRGTALRSGLSD